ncbi:hypothetical protein BIV25_02035 [Streptomyces sp. MUSC 14]|uniref:hypothetical protein n=1 Tax=Streptomyces sp. MUSC 14 TaxID=1354889 RepID=UPI0008F56553|nr:hypothetical protein [Streptomyces sp. MUSC 14]OIK02680.1 hypothetical protein BIV25_02035 [Streptomyces sp. MUSC 14]
MDSAELVERLREADVPEAFYDIPGIHDVPIQLDAYYFLCREGDGWTVGLRQRSQDSVMQSFATETEACAYLYETLIQSHPSPSPPTQPLEELLANTEEIQRQAWEDFDRHREAADDG